MTKQVQQEDKLQKVDVVNSSGKLQTYSYKDLRTIDLPTNESELKEHIRKISQSLSAKTIFTNWYLGRCADESCKNDEDSKITEILSDMASECNISLRYIQYCRSLYLMFNTEQDMDDLYKMVKAGISWTNFIEIIFPLPDLVFDDFKAWLVDKIEKGDMPDVSAMRDKAKELTENHKQIKPDTQGNNTNNNNNKTQQEDEVSSNVNTVDNAQKNLNKLSEKWEEKLSAVINSIEDLECEQLNEEILTKYNDSLVDLLSQLDRLVTTAVNTQVTIVNRTNRNRSYLADIATRLLDNYDGTIYLTENEDGHIEFVSSPEEKYENENEKTDTEEYTGN